MRKGDIVAGRCGKVSCTGEVDLSHDVKVGRTVECDMTAPVLQQVFKVSTAEWL